MAAISVVSSKSTPIIRDLLEALGLEGFDILGPSVDQEDEESRLALLMRTADRAISDRASLLRGLLVA